MLVILFCLVWLTLLAKPLLLSNSEEFLFLPREALNKTIICTFDGFDYSLISAPFNNVTCDGLMRDAAAAMDISSNDRSVVNIVWSCLSTIFACTWVSLHPNVPHPDTSEWHIRRHRFFMMVCGIIAPELLVLLALREWLGARTLVKMMNSRDFTMVHGHFMLMGGFMLHWSGQRVGIITDFEELKYFIRKCKVTLPTKEEICDKSKGDGLSKAFVVGQCGWFVVQLFSRWINGLAITEIELVTLAFAALNGITYFLWWKKPLDVRYGVHVTPILQEQGTTSRHEECLSETTTIAQTHSLQSSVKMTPGIRSLGFLQSPSSVLSYTVDPRAYGHDDVVIIARFLQARSIFIRKLCPAILLAESDAEDKRRLQASMLDIKVSIINTFVATLSVSVIGMLFGAIHLIAWNFHFPTPYERTMWRVFSIVMTIAPAAFSIRAICGHYFAWWMSRHRFIDLGTVRPPNQTFTRWAHQINTLSIWVTFFFVPLYIIARCGLLVESLAALRSLGLKEKSQIQWIDLLPHL